MAPRYSKKARHYPKHFRNKGLSGKKENIFYVDEKSKHPFISQSRQGLIVFGHNVTHHPSLNPDGSIKKKYRVFPSTVNHGGMKSYFDTTLERIDNTPSNGKKTGRLKMKKWPVSSANRKKLRKVERERVKRIKKNAR